MQSIFIKEAATEVKTELSKELRNIDRIINSIIEEIQAVNDYHQRAFQTNDKELSEIMIHNRDEEIEHFVINIEYLRRNLPEVDKYLKEFLFKEGNIISLEKSTKSEE
jgi:uncharacterized protein